MQSSNAILRFLKLEQTTPGRHFGLLLSLACLALPACRAEAPKDQEEDSSEKDSKEGSNEKEPEDSEEPGSNDDPEKSEENSEEDESEGSEEGTPDEESDDDPSESGGEDPDKSGGSERDCEKIEWGKKGLKKGKIVARGDVLGFADSNNDFKPEKKEVDAGMCELHLTKYRCAMVLYGAG